MRTAEHHTNRIELLLVGGNPNLANIYANALRNQGQAANVDCAEDGVNLDEYLSRTRYDILLLPDDIKGLSATDAIKIIRSKTPQASVIMLSEEPATQLDLARALKMADVVHPDNKAQLAFSILREYRTISLKREHHYLQQKLHDTEDRIQSLMGKSGDAIAYVYQGMHRHANSIYCDMFGIRNEDHIEGLPLLDLISSKDQAKFKQILRKFQHQESLLVDVECCAIKGDCFTATMELSCIVIEGEECTQVLIRDNAQEEKLNLRIHELANQDIDTGLHNRHAFIQRLEAVLRDTQSPEKIFLVQVSISNYVALRDVEGLQKTDALLKASAKALQQYSTEAEIVARFGEHDFMLLWTNQESAKARVECCEETLNKYDLGNRLQLRNAPVFTVTSTQATANISAYALAHQSCQAIQKALPQPEANASVAEFATDLAPQAIAATADVQHDMASSVVKPSVSQHDINDQPGIQKNPAMFSEQHTQVDGGDDQSIVKLIDQALEKDLFQLVYQHMVGREEDNSDHYSVLLRLPYEDGIPRTPQSFWPHAQTANRTADIDRWVIRHAIKYLVERINIGHQVHFHMNISNAGMADDAMLLWICDCMRECKAQGSWITIQFREKDLHDQLPSTQKLVDGLRKVQCRIAVSHYRGLPGSDKIMDDLNVDWVTFSADWLIALAHDKTRQQQLSELNGQLQEKGMTTIATGVEDPSDMALLWGLGIDYIQGFLLHEPQQDIEEIKSEEF